MPDDDIQIPDGGSVPVEASLASLVSGIIGDVQTLVAQQIRLTRQEIAANLRLCRAAVALIAGGAALGLIATVLLGFSVVHILHWLASPAGTDPAWLPMGACYAIVSMIVYAVSAGLIYVGRTKIRYLPPWENSADQLL